MYFIYNFPSFSEGLSLRVAVLRMVWVAPRRFPFLFGGTFIEGLSVHHLLRGEQLNFPSFSEGLSLRAHGLGGRRPPRRNFPSCSEGLSLRVRFAEHALTSQRRFPFLLGRAFIEAVDEECDSAEDRHFPSFWEGLSLRHSNRRPELQLRFGISLPSGKGFH